MHLQAFCLPLKGSVEAYVLRNLAADRQSDSGQQLLSRQREIRAGISGGRAALRLRGGSGNTSNPHAVRGWGSAAAPDPDRGRQLQPQAAQQPNRHQPDVQLRQRLAQADPLAAAEGQQGEARVPFQVPLGAEGLEVVGGLRARDARCGAVVCAGRGVFRGRSRLRGAWRFLDR